MTSETDVLVDANSLRLTITQKKQIKTAVREVLLHLNHSIMQAHEAGKSNIIDKLPMQFAIDGMTFTKMQQHVWCAVIAALKNKNYKVAIEPVETECTIYIKWESEDDIEESRHQLKILAKHTIRS